MTPARTGEITAGRMIFEISVPKFTALAPAATTTAPMRPPNRACDELDGSPSSQVIRFHRMAPMRPAKMMYGLILVSSTRPLEIVLATSTERNAPTTFRTPEMRTATLGFSAPVAIDVAMAFAVSWKPLVKSNANAVTMTTMTIREMPICRGPVPLRRARTSGARAPRSIVSGRRRRYGALAARPVT